MTESQTTLHESNARMKKVPIQERSVLVRDSILVNGYGVDRICLRQRFSELFSPFYSITHLANAPRSFPASHIRFETQAAFQVWVV